MSEPMRLQRYLARAGIASRRACEKLIEDGLVQVNGRVAELGMKVVPGVDEVVCKGSVVELPRDTVVIALNKPAGYLTSASDPHHTRFVTDLLPMDRFPGLFPIGRLDKDTTGLLLFTNDGELGNKLAHPSHEVDKRYHAWVEGAVDQRSLVAFREGVMLEDGMTAPAKAMVLKRSEGDERTLLSITIHEGRNRQVRRMCEAVGHPVLSLERVGYASLTLEGIARGSYRMLSNEEIADLSR